MGVGGSTEEREVIVAEAYETVTTTASSVGSAVLDAGYAVANAAYEWYNPSEPATAESTNEQDTANTDPPHESAPAADATTPESRTESAADAAAEAKRREMFGDPEEYRDRSESALPPSLRADTLTADEVAAAAAESAADAAAEAKRREMFGAVDDEDDELAAALAAQAAADQAGFK